MQTNDLVFQNGPEFARMIRSREVSPVEVATAFLDRAEALNPKVNSFITITRDHALARAREAERGDTSGPLPWPPAWNSLRPERHPGNPGNSDDEWIEGDRRLDPRL